MASLKDIMVSGVTYDLLKENGRLDRRDGKSMAQGWEELRKEAGYSDGRTPAREAYEDGYYEGERAT